MEAYDRQKLIIDLCFVNIDQLRLGDICPTATSVRLRKYLQFGGLHWFQGIYLEIQRYDFLETF
jgi:hypothetical protein